ncbi:hypothetical protein IT397_01665 [Candidatus Nomurabacteria bacterium]|nr:hypothetical protein [Candidatus Nomurabacteria bacterium]
MKNLLLLFIVLLHSHLFSQVQEKKTFFSSSEFGIYGGINFITRSDIGNSFLFEGKTNFSSHLKLKLSVGYSKIYSSDNYNVKTFDYVSINGVEKYYAISYDVIKKEYQFIPISLGIQHTFLKNIFSPYTVFEFGYNLIDPNIHKLQFQPIGEYNSYDDLPNDYKNSHVEILPNSSYTIGLGGGTTYKLSSSINFDIRYLYRIDNEKINFHQLIFGFLF